MGGKWPYNSCFVGCCFQDLFKTTRSILIYFPSSFFSIRSVNVQVLHPYSSTDTATVWKKSSFILLERSYFDNLSIAVHTFTRYMLTPLSVDKILLLRYVNWSTNFRGLSLKLEMAPSCLKHVGLYCRSKDELVSNFFLWTISHGHASVSRPTTDLHASALRGHWMQS